MNLTFILNSKLAQLVGRSVNFATLDASTSEPYGRFAPDGATQLLLLAQGEFVAAKICRLVMSLQVNPAN